MTKNPELISKYQRFYQEIRDLVSDNEIYPALDYEDFKEYVSQENWLGVPSFSMSKEDLTNSDHAHISFRISDNKVFADLFFNGKKAVDRFINILHSTSKNEREDFINLVKSLDDKYSILVQYAVKVPLAKAPWTPVKKLKCKNLSENDVNELLNVIRDTLDKREKEQKEYGTKRTVTLSVRLGAVEIDENNKEQLKEAFTNFAKLARIVHQLKSKREIEKIEKSLPKEIETLENDINSKEQHLVNSRRLSDTGFSAFSKENLDKEEKEISELKKKLDEKRSIRENR